MQSEYCIFSFKFKNKKYEGQAFLDEHFSAYRIRLTLIHLTYFDDLTATVCGPLVSQKFKQPVAYRQYRGNTST